MFVFIYFPRIHLTKAEEWINRNVLRRHIRINESAQLMMGMYKILSVTLMRVSFVPKLFDYFVIDQLKSSRSK